MADEVESKVANMSINNTSQIRAALGLGHNNTYIGYRAGDDSAPTVCYETCLGSNTKGGHGSNTITIGRITGADSVIIDPDFASSGDAPGGIGRRGECVYIPGDLFVGRSLYIEGDLYVKRNITCTNCLDASPVQ